METNAQNLSLCVFNQFFFRVEQNRSSRATLYLSLCVATENTERNETKGNERKRNERKGEKGIASTEISISFFFTFGSGQVDLNGGVTTRVEDLARVDGSHRKTL
jgi:hypothetical protein